MISIVLEALRLMLWIHFAYGRCWGERGEGGRKLNGWERFERGLKVPAGRSVRNLCLLV